MFKLPLLDEEDFSIGRLAYGALDFSLFKKFSIYCQGVWLSIKLLVYVYNELSLNYPLQILSLIIITALALAPSLTVTVCQLKLNHFVGVVQTTIIQ